MSRIYQPYDKGLGNLAVYAQLFDGDLIYDFAAQQFSAVVTDGTKQFMVEQPSAAADLTAYYLVTFTPPDGGPYSVKIKLAADDSLIGNDLVWGGDAEGEEAETTGDFSINVSDALTEALENLQSIDVGTGLEGFQVDSLIRTLNITLKTFQTQILGLWTWRHASLILDKSTAGYLLGPTGDHATPAYVQTTLGTDAAATDTTVDLTSAAGIVDGYNIGIVLDSGALHWATVSEVSGTAISAALPSSAAAGNAVFAYSAKIQRPMEIKDVRLKYLTGDERPCNVVPVSEYNMYPIKNTASEVVNVAHEPLLGNTLLHAWPVSAYAGNVLNFQYKQATPTLSSLEDVIAAPADCLKAIIAALTSDLAPKFGATLAEQQNFERKAKMLKDEMHDFEDDTSICFAPGRW